MLRKACKLQDIIVFQLVWLNLFKHYFSGQPQMVNLTLMQKAGPEQFPIGIRVFAVSLTSRLINYIWHMCKSFVNWLADRLYLRYV